MIFSTTQNIKNLSPFPWDGRSMAENEFLDMKKLKLIGDDCLEARPCFVEVLPWAACSLVTQDKKFANRLKVGKVRLVD